MDFDHIIKAIVKINNDNHCADNDAILDYITSNFASNIDKATLCNAINILLQQNRIIDTSSATGYLAIQTSNIANTHFLEGVIQPRFSTPDIHNTSPPLDVVFFQSQIDEINKILEENLSQFVALKSWAMNELYEIKETVTRKGDRSECKEHNEHKKQIDFLKAEIASKNTIIEILTENLKKGSSYKQQPSLNEWKRPRKSAKKKKKTKKIYF